MAEQQDDAGMNIVIMPPSAAVLTGVWSNLAMVAHSDYEFTIDFVRVDFHQQTENGSSPAQLVSKVLLSPLMVTQLIEALNTNWASYARKAMPPEVHDADNP